MRYHMHRKLALPVGQGFLFDDDEGQTRYSAGLKPFIFHMTVGLRDAGGHDLLTIRLLNTTMPPTHFEIVRGDETTDVRQHFQDGHQHYTATAASGECVEVAGDWQAETFTFLRHGREIGRMVGEWYALQARYDIEVAPGEDDTLVLALVLIIHITNEPAQSR